MIMTRTFASSLLFLVISVFDSADAVSCYHCSYANDPHTGFIGTSTCREQLNATTIIANCSAPICTLTFGNYSQPRNFKVVVRGCLNDTDRTPADLCDSGFIRTSENYTTFNYNDGCCITSGPVSSEGSTYTLTTCYCQTDNCNGNIPLTVAPLTVAPLTVASSTVAPPTTTLKPPVGDR